jgi:hypothetical protein
METVIGVLNENGLISAFAVFLMILIFWILKWAFRQQELIVTQLQEDRIQFTDILKLYKSALDDLTKEIRELVILHRK